MGLLLALLLFYLCWRICGLFGLSPAQTLIGSLFGTVLLLPLVTEQLRLTLELIRDPMLGPLPLWPALFLLLLIAAVLAALWCLRRGINPFDPFKP